MLHLLIDLCRALQPALGSQIIARIVQSSREYKLHVLQNFLLDDNIMIATCKAFAIYSATCALQYGVEVACWDVIFPGRCDVHAGSLT